MLDYIRTDLALEAGNFVKEENGELKGVKVVENMDRKNCINVIRMDILNRYGAQSVGKPIGTYITMEVPKLTEHDEGSHREISKAFARELKNLIISEYHWNESTPKILIAGLGNRDTTPDSLGPRAVDNLMVTRHIIEYMGYEEIEGAFAVVSAIIPGVMANTGMESSEIVNAIIKKIKPDILIVIDALAARSISRVNTTIQLTDNGICPGSGVENNRQAINKKTMGIPVIAVGIPTVVDASTLVYDALKKNGKRNESGIGAEYEGMYVTTKDIDAVIKKVSFTISEGINMCMGLV